MMPFLVIGDLSIPTFFIVISLSLSFLVIYLSHRVDKYEFDRKIAFDIALIVMISGFLGGRLMHVIYEEPAFYKKHPWQILYFWQGGYVFYGGFILCLLSVITYCRINKIYFLKTADFFAPLLSLSHAFGRLGCFFAGCCYGAKCEIPWAIENRHPTTLYLFFGELLIFAYLIFFERKIRDLNVAYLNGAVFMKWVLLHSLLRLNVEYYRDDFRGAFFSVPLFGNLSVSQLISLILMFISLGYFISKMSYFRKVKIKSSAS